MKKFFDIAIILTMFFCLTIQANMMIYLKNEAVCGEKVMLKHVARFAGSIPTDSLKNMDMSDLSVNDKIEKNAIDLRIKGKFTDLKFKIFGPTKVSLTRNSFCLKGSEVKKKIKQWVMEKLSGHYDSLGLAIRGDVEDFFFENPPDSFLIEGNILKRTNLINPEITYYCNGEEVFHERVGVYVKKFNEGYSVVSPARKGEKASKVKYEKKLFPVFKTNDGVVNNLKEIEGAIVKKNLSPGEILKKRYFYFPNLVRKNDLISVSYNNNDFALRVRVKALENGKKGEIIKAENPRSGKKIMVKVTSKNNGEIVL